MNLLDRARTLLQGLTPAAPPKVQWYNVVCAEGHPLRGQRTVGYQALRCPACGEGVFVLPRSPLPEPPVPTSSLRDRDNRPPQGLEPEPEPIPLTDHVLIQEAPEAGLDGEVVWADESPGAGMIDPADAGLAEIEQMTARERHAASPESRQGHGLKGASGTVAPERAPRSSAKAARRGFPAEIAADAGEDEARSPGVRLAEWALQWRNPLLFLAVILLIAATIGFRMWRQHRQDLPQIAALGRIDGLAALDEGEFDKAHQLLSRARHAVESLGDAVEGAAQIRQGAAEAEIFVSLVPDRLEAILDAAGRSDATEWPARFSTLYKGRSIIVDAYVIAAEKTSGQTRYELDYQILPDGEGKLPRVGRIDTTGFGLFQATQPKLGDHVTFGARLASFAYDERTKEWRVGLEPQSGVFLTHPKALEALGWPTFAEPSATEGTAP